MSDGDVLQTFRLFDRDGDGSIDKNELEEVLKALDPHTWTDENLDKLIASADVNQDGRIQFEEFQDWALSGGSDSRGFREAVQEFASPTSAYTRAYVDALSSTSHKPKSPKRYRDINVRDDNGLLCTVSI